MWNAGLDESQAGIKTAKRNINNFRYANDTTLMAGNEEDQKRPQDGGYYANQADGVPASGAES